MKKLNERFLIDPNKMNEISYMSAAAHVEILWDDLEALYKAGKITQSEQSSHQEILQSTQNVIDRVFPWILEGNKPEEYGPENFYIALDDIAVDKSIVMHFIVSKKFKPATLKT